MVASELALRPGWPGGQFPSSTKPARDLALARVTEPPNGWFHGLALAGSRALGLRKGSSPPFWFSRREWRNEALDLHGASRGDYAHSLMPHPLNRELRWRMAAVS